MENKAMKLVNYTIRKSTDKINEIPWNIKIIKATDFWEKGNNGRGRTIAIIDTGCDINHPDLKNRIIEGKNFTSEDNGDQDNFKDYDGHGTHVAGIIAGSLNENGVGVGVAPEANLLILKAVRKGEVITPEWKPISIIKAINYAIEFGNVDIISISLGWEKNFPELHAAIKRAVEKNILVVCAASNEGDDNGNTIEITYPGAYNEVISVGAIDSNKKVANFSNSNQEVDLVAPGVEILSTFPNNDYVTLDGTSMSAPHVSGALALIINWAKNSFGRELSEPELYAQLIRRTISLGNKKTLEGNGMLYLNAVDLLEDFLDKGNRELLQDEHIKMLRNSSGNSGFNPKFLGEEFKIPFPKIIGKTKEDALNDGEIFNFINFSVVMNEKTKFAIYSVCNIDENKEVKISRTDDWHFDQRIKEENQVGNEFYRNNPWDRGHLTRRKDVCWGTERQAREANYDSFCFANICLQDHDLNTNTWNDFEDWILDELEGQNMKMKMSIFTGPINRDSDRIYCGEGRGQSCGVRIPAGFWKVVIYVDSNNELCCLAFLVKQDEFWYDETGKKLEKYKIYQVPLNLISELTEIEFDSSLYNANPLYYWPNRITARNNITTPQIHIISEREDIIF